MAQVLMIIAQNGFRDEELLETKESLEDEGIDVVIASKQKGKAVGKLGAKVEVDISYTDIDFMDYDAIIFVGGPGASDYFDDKEAHRLAVDSFESGKIVAAICIAPVILANAGLLKGIKATCFSSVSKQIEAKGAKYTGNSVEVSGRIVTANGPEAAKEFGELIAGMIR